ncbi:MAG TPA: diaminopimelate epimerase [Fimbriimonadaceae bacterium]|jgi:diaminopimelate epimerase
MLPFTKLHGLGNDFVFIDQVKNEYLPALPSELAPILCDRRFGVGADGLILVKRGDTAPFRMTIINRDGTNGGMCGNGVRCAARLLVENGHQSLEPFDLEVEERVVHVDPVRPDWIRVNMGMALLDRRSIAMAGPPEEQFVDGQILCDGQTFSATAVFTGNPHLALFTDDVEAIDIERLGPLLEHHELFPAQINVHFVQVLDRGHLKMRVWERGVGITLACGSGACSVAVAGFITGRSERKVRITLPGGDLLIDYLESGEVLMEGPAERVFDGEWIGELSKVDLRVPVG